MNLIELQLLKSRSGYYKDNSKNRKLGRVGQPYGKSSSGDETFEEKEKKYRNKGFTYSSTSLQEYKGDKNREKLHRKIVNDYVSRSSKYGRKPVSVFTLGGSGAGKSTVLNKLKQENELYNNIVAVDSDDIKMKSFKNDFEIYNRQSTGSAAGRLHDESSIVADEIVKGIQDVQNDYLKDGTMKSLNKAIKEIMDARSKGYEVNIIGVTISVEEALERAKIRGKRTGRIIGPDTIIKAHTGSTKTFLKLIEMGIADSMKLYDNSGKEPVLIYDSEKEPPIVNEILFESFKNKKDFVMKEESPIEKSVKFVPRDSDKEFKRLCQEAPEERKRIMYYDVPNDADEWDIEMARQANEWLHDGKPVENN